MSSDVCCCDACYGSKWSSLATLAAVAAAQEKNAKGCCCALCRDPEYSSYELLGKLIAAQKQEDSSSLASLAQQIKTVEQRKWFKETIPQVASWELTLNQKLRLLWRLVRSQEAISNKLDVSLVRVQTNLGTWEIQRYYQPDVVVCKTALLVLDRGSQETDPSVDLTS